MSISPGHTLKFRDGAEQLDLPDGAKKAFLALQEVVKKESPRMERKGDNTLYLYNRTEQCEAFSTEILAIKEAQDVFRILSLEGLERGSKVISVPTIYGFGTCGPRVVEGYAALAVLISASVEIEIHSISGSISHHWQSGKILFLKPGTYISFNYKGELQDASMDIKEHENDDQDASVGIKEHENDGMEVRSQMESGDKDASVDIKEHGNDDQSASVGIKEHENDGMEVRSQMESDEKRSIVYYTMFQVRPLRHAKR